MRLTMIMTINFPTKQKIKLGLLCLLLSHFPAQANTLSPFDKAMQYVEQGQWFKAETLLSYQLEQKPDHHRARLELAMVLMQTQDYDEAKKHLSTLLQVKQLPENVRFNIDVMLNQINDKQQAQLIADTQPKHDWNFGIDVALGYDSNVRFSFGDYFLEDDPYADGTYLQLGDGSYVFYSPDGNVYDMAGNILDAEALNIDLGPREQDTAYTEAKLLVEHNYKRDNFDWNSSFLLQNSDNKEFSDFDKSLYKLQSEVSWQLSEHTEFSTEYEHRTIVRGGHTLLTANAITFNYGWLNSYGNFDIYLEFMQRDFSDSETMRGNTVTTFQGFDNDSVALGVDWSKFYFNQRLLTKVNLEYKKNKASDDLDYEGLQTKVVAIYRLADKWNLAGYLSYFEQDYDSHLITDRLTDKSTKFGTKLDYQLAPNKEIFIGLDRGLRNSDIYGDVSSAKTNVKLGVAITF